MNKIRLLIADSDQEFTQHLQTMLAQCPDIALIGIADNAGDALMYVRRENPDVVLFDMILSGMDGISFLRSMRMLKIDLVSICCTAFYSSISIEAARRYGASYFLYKPLDFHSVYSAITNCYELNTSMNRSSAAISEPLRDSTSVYLRIRNYVVSLGIPAKLIGCNYLTEAIRLAKTDPDLMSNLSKGLYLEISRNMKSTPERIERCMRSAISIAHQRGSLRQHMIACPSNKEFIIFALYNIDLRI